MRRPIELLALPVSADESPLSMMGTIRRSRRPPARHEPRGAGRPPKSSHLQPSPDVVLCDTLFLRREGLVVDDDAKLVQRWQGPNEQDAEKAFADLYARYAGFAERYARKVARDDWPDVCNEAWLRIIGSRR